MVGEKSNKWKGTEVNVIRWTNDSFGIDRRGWLGIRDELFFWSSKGQPYECS